MLEEDVHKSGIRWLITAAGAVVVWRALGVAFPHSADSDAEIVRWLMALLGLWFTGWGVWTFLSRRDTVSRMFAWYGIAAGVHWGGPVGVGAASTQNLLLAVYVLIGVALYQSLFLRLSLAFPPAMQAAGRPAALVAVYAPVLAACLLLGVLATRPTDENVLAVFLVFFPVGVLYSLVGGVIFVRRLLIADRPTRRRHRLPLVIVAMVAGWLPHALVASTEIGPGPELAGLFNLSFLLLPPALAWALARPRTSAPAP